MARAITVGTVNVCGFARKRSPLIYSLEQDLVSVISIQETKASRPISLPGYDIHQQNSILGALRGVAIACHRSIPSRRFPLPPRFEYLECVAATIFFNSFEVIYISLYNPPAEPLDRDFLDYFASLPHAILAGDLNARHTDFGDSNINPNGTILNNCLLNLPIYRARHADPTFVGFNGMSIPDHLLFTEDITPFIASNTAFVGTTVTSDHQPLLIKMSLGNSPPTFRGIRQIRDMRNADWNAFRLDITQISTPFQQSVNHEEIDQQVSTFTDSISQAFNRHVPLKNIILGRKPLPPQIINLIRLKRSTLRQFQRSRDPATKTEWNRLNASVRLQINLFNQNKWIEECASLDYRDGKRFWTKFKALTGQYRRPNQPIVHNNEIAASPIDKARIFAESLEQTHQVPNNPNFNNPHFIRISNEIAEFRRENSTLLELPVDDPFLSPITPDAIKEALPRGRGKAPGLDNLGKETLQNIPDISLSNLAVIYNNCLRAAYFPKSWKQALQVLIPKPGKDPSLVTSYRPISLLNLLGKVFERLLINRLKIFCEAHVLPPNQHGFRTAHSTHDPLVKLTNDVNIAKNLGKCTLAVFLDVEKAFDQVWHDGLIHKLLTSNIPRHMVHLLTSFLSNRSAIVKVFQARSRSYTLRAGVPQGSVLSPLLYSIYSYDFPISGPTINTELYADDIAIWSTNTSSVGSQRAIQKSLNKVNAWAGKWRVTINSNKSQSILFRHPNMANTSRLNPNHVSLLLNNSPIPLLRDIKYLGITFDQYANFQTDLQNSLRKLRNRFNLLRLLRGRLGGCDSRTLHFTYNTFMRPILEYRSVVYSALKDPNPILQCERRILRNIYGLHFMFPSIQVYAEVNAVPLTDRMSKLQAKYCQRTLEGQNIPAQQTLRTPWHGRFRPFLTRRPKRKFPHIAARLLSTIENVPDEYMPVLDDTPLSLR